MTIKPHIASNRENSLKSTGPKTALGKAKVSSNAIVHGARAKSFINANEEDAYKLLLAELEKQYPSNNPLIKIQLDRIAKTKIQADRIQKTIDAIFAASELEDVSDEALMNLLEMDDSDKKTAQRISAGDLDLGGLVNHERIKIAAELSHLDPTKLTSQEDFISHAPSLCKFLLKESKEYNVNIDTYISRHAIVFKNENGWLQNFYKMIVKDMHGKSEWDNPDLYDLSKPMPPTPTIENTIPSVKLESLQKAADLFKNELNKLRDIHHKVIAFNQLKKIEKKPIALNYDHLDKLQRYQTTIQGQLSRMMGELLALTK